MKYFLTVIMTLLVVVWIAVGVGILQNDGNDPTRGCTRFETYTKYQGYHCKNKNIYLLNNNY